MARKGPAAHAEERKGMGFKAAVASAAAGGARNPAAAIASAAQHASPAAKRRNPNLSKVGGVGRPGHRGAGQAG
jgi:uncharacterized protein (UPF0333 family)